MKHPPEPPSFGRERKSVVFVNVVVRIRLPHRRRRGSWYLLRHYTSAPIVYVSQCNISWILNYFCRKREQQVVIVVVSDCLVSSLLICLLLQWPKLFTMIIIILLIIINPRGFIKFGREAMWVFLFPSISLVCWERVLEFFDWVFVKKWRLIMVLIMGF